MKDQFIISCISNKYKVKKLEENDIDDIYNLCKNNPTYYKYCPPNVTKESIKEDMKALPINKTLKDKFYVGLYDDEKLVAILDLILDYPNSDSAFIGFFMLDKKYQGKGVGSKIIEELLHYLKAIGYMQVELAYVKNNTQSEKFWTKNKFEKTGKEVEKYGYIAVRMKRQLKDI